MAAPPLILAAVRDLLRLPETETILNARIEAAFQRALTELTRETDLFAQLQQITTVAAQAQYAAVAGTTRILAVLHNGTILHLVPSRSLDLLTTWGQDDPGEPESWTMDKLPNSTPLDFAVHPAPAVAGSNGEGITLIRIGTPVNDAPPPWIFPFLIFKTASIFTGESTEDRDMPASSFFEALAGIWRDLLVG